MEELEKEAFRGGGEGGGDARHRPLSLPALQQLLCLPHLPPRPPQQLHLHLHVAKLLRKPAMQSTSALPLSPDYARGSTRLHSAP